MNETSLQEQIVRRLNLLILLELERANSESGVTITSKIQRLISLGLQPAEIASIVGKPVNYVTAVTSKKAAREKRNG
jgi:hypothetical protein